MKIAVYIDSSGGMASFYDPGLVRVYEGGSGAWNLMLEVPFRISADMGLGQVKAAVHALVNELNDCKVFLSREVHGVLYTILQEELGCQTWCSAGTLFEQLDMVASRTGEEALRKKNELMVLPNGNIPTPIAIGSVEGSHYWFDLARALSSATNATSRQILIPFLEKVAFQKLEIICDHMPKWLAWELDRLQLSAECEELDVAGGLRLSVYPPIDRSGRVRPVGLLGSGPALNQPCHRERRMAPPPPLSLGKSQSSGCG